MSVLPPLRRLSDHINQAAIVLCVGCILSMLGISFTAFLYKLFTGSTLSWTYSLARLFLPWDRLSLNDHFTALWRACGDDAVSA